MKRVWDDFPFCLLGVFLFIGRRMVFWGGDFVDLGHTTLDVFSLLKVLGMTFPNRSYIGEKQKA